VAFNMLAGRVSGPVARLVQVWQEFQQAGIAVARLGDVLDTPPEPQRSIREARARVRGRVTFENVTFRYRTDGPAALRDVSFDVAPGEVVGLVGRSGCGKSTVAALIQRLYLPGAGRVLIDGLDLSLLDPVWLRRQVGVVPQESFLFNRSVRANIALADPGAPFERVVQVAELAGAHEFIRQLPDGYDTVVGEHGSALSGGQRQRIAIARALLGHPGILILDEATSALDGESEAIIQGNLGQMCQGRTVFLIAHRLSALRPAHRMLLLDEGQLLEQGTHDDLLRRNGRYASLYGRQDGRGLDGAR
jgi:subfamily B ATP-binding cassette protein HlyB/CyaB